MTTDRNKREEIIFYCDWCEASLQTMARDPDEAAGIAASEGWKTWVTGGRHSCPACTKEIKL